MCVQNWAADTTPGSSVDPKYVPISREGRLDQSQQYLGSVFIERSQCGHVGVVEREHRTHGERLMESTGWTD